MMQPSYYPNYYSLEDIFVTQEKVECVVNTKLLKMGKLIQFIKCHHIHLN